MHEFLGIPLTGPNSWLDWGLWIAVILVGYFCFCNYFKRWTKEKKELTRQERQRIEAEQEEIQSTL